MKESIPNTCMLHKGSALLPPSPSLYIYTRKQWSADQASPCLEYTLSALINEIPWVQTASSAIMQKDFSWRGKTNKQQQQRKKTTTQIKNNQQLHNFMFASSGIKRRYLKLPMHHGVGITSNSWTIINFKLHIHFSQFSSANWSCISWCAPIICYREYI